MEAEFIPGKKYGSSYLVHANNHLYSRVYNKPLPPPKRKTKDAPYIVNSFVKSAHNHVADISKIQKLKAVARAKHDCLEQPALKPRIAFANLASNMDATGEVLPIKYSALARSMCRVKSQRFVRPRSPNTYKEVDQWLGVFPVFRRRTRILKKKTQSC